LPSKFLTKSKTVLTGITRPEYRKAVQNGSDIEWCCRGCFVYDVLPDFESTRIEDDLTAETASFNRYSASLQNSQPPSDSYFHILSQPSPSQPSSNGSVVSEVPTQFEFTSPQSSDVQENDRSPVEFPEPMEESSLEDPAPDPAIAEAEVAVITYEIVLEGTKRQKRKLVDSAGYSYNVKERGRTTTYWQCTVRPKGNYCRATVKETDGNFVPGRQSHNHPPQVGALKAAHIMTQVKRKAMEDIFKPGTSNC